MAFFRNDPVIGRALREYGEWAQIEIDLLLTLIDAGSVVLDLGAYIGTHTLAFATKTFPYQGRVHGFEPIPDHFSVLQRNVQANGADTITLHNAGLSVHRRRNERAASGSCRRDQFRRNQFGQIATPGRSTTHKYDNAGRA